MPRGPAAPSRQSCPDRGGVLAGGLCGDLRQHRAVGYQPERLDSFTTTGILGTVQRNADLLEGVETRAEQVTPYLKNLLALSAALQDKYPRRRSTSRWPRGCCWCRTSTARTSTP